MARTIYATFRDEPAAERAAGALLDHGVLRQDVSFIVPQQPATPSVLPPRDRGEREVLGGPPDDIPILDAPVPSSPKLPNVNSGAALHPPVEPDGIQTGMGYTFDTLEAVVPEEAMIRFQTPAAQVVSTAPGVAALPADAPIDTVEHDRRPHAIDMKRMEPDAASGVSTTTPGDAGKGALGGAGIGIGLGVLLGLAAVAIPGVGFVAGTGALVAGLAAATGAAGGVAGAAYGWLNDLNLPPETTTVLRHHLVSGGPLLSITVSGNVAEDDIRMLLRKYGALSEQAFG